MSKKYILIALFFLISSAATAQIMLPAYQGAFAKQVVSTGGLNNALNFDGVDDYVLVSSSSALNITSNISLSAWIYRNSSGKYDCIIGKDNYAGNNGYSLWIYNDDKLTLRFGNSRIYQSNNSIPTGSWVHVAGTFDGTNAKLYINGTLDSYYSASAPSSNSGLLYLGTPQDAVGNTLFNFSGTLEDIRIWNIALTQSAIQSSMNSELLGNETGLVANYSFNQGIAGGDNTAISIVTDKTANAFNGTLTNFTKNGASSNFVAGKLTSSIVSSGLVLHLDAGNKNSYNTTRIITGAKIYSVYAAGLRSANYTVQYSDDNSNWTTAFTGVMSNNSSCGFKTGSGVGLNSVGAHRYWRYVEGSSVVGHHPRTSRIILIDSEGAEHTIARYTDDNCSDLGGYQIGTVSYDFTSEWTDLSGNSNHGTLINGPTYSSANGGTMVFDGIDDRVQSSFNPTFTDFTVCVWYKDNGSSSYGRLVDNNYVSGFWIGKNANTPDQWGAGIKYSGYPYGIYLTLPDGQWHLLTTTRSGTTHSIYGDGITNKVSTSVTGAALNGTNLSMGEWSGGGVGQIFKGSIPQVIIYNRALSETEIMEIFNATRTRYGL